MAKNKRTLSDEEREQRRAEQRELVRASIEQLRSSDGWQAYLKVRSRFHSYSWRNVLLILHQHPTAQRVAGFRAWLNLGYCVTKASRAIRIWAPCPPPNASCRRGVTRAPTPTRSPAAASSSSASLTGYLVFGPEDVVDARVGRYVACRLAPGCSSAPAPRRRGRLWPARSSRSRRPRATAQRRSRARLAGTPGNRSALTRCRECRHPVPIPAISRTDGKLPKAAALH